ncbi:TetR/AcrR family transcriptional regulator [Salinicola halimionae]|uniref:TetR/AcrR family transcriptional regulator n=1 Tax=Salinicola halimionae TaxID=1949081 RepID=UPI000DA23573|nr:TetR/AcrR family transcriptional regulator [Salinicola halimionae]
MPTNARDRLITTAETLFYREGIQAVGISELIAAAGIGRASFYRHFESKEALLHAVLRCRNEKTLTVFGAALASCGSDPLRVFDVVAERYGADDFRGCAFINAMVEAADRHGETHRIAREHKLAQIRLLSDRLHESGYRQPDRLAGHFQLLIDGAVVGVLREGNTRPVEMARDIASHLLVSWRPTHSNR